MLNNVKYTFTIVYLLIVILWYFVLCHFASKCLVCHCFDVLSFHSAELWYPFLPCIHALHCNVRICVYTCIKFPANAEQGSGVLRAHPHDNWRTSNKMTTIVKSGHCHWHILTLLFDISILDPKKMLPMHQIHRLGLLPFGTLASVHFNWFPWVLHSPS